MGEHHHDKKKDEKNDVLAKVDAKGGEKERTFDLEDPKLPKWVSDRAFGSGGYPHGSPFDEDEFDAQLERLQIELVKLQTWAIDKGERIVVVFEGRDAAGKGSVIGALRQYMNPRRTRVVALPKPTDVESGQWYFQRYVEHMPTRGEVVMFDRSWYNRAGVEPVMGFCTPEQTDLFLKEAPRFEDMLTDEGIRVVKFWIDVGREMQLSRFHDRRHNPLKVWKISPIDHAAIDKYDDYGRARDRMLERAHTDGAPWTIVLGNDKRRLKLEAIRHVLMLFDYPNKDRKAIGDVDEKVIGKGAAFFNRRD